MLFWAIFLNEQPCARISTVTFQRNDDRVQTYRIVGEDEADPKTGSISFVSPVANLLMDKTVGDAVSMAGQDLEILAIS